MSEEEKVSSNDKIQNPIEKNISCLIFRRPLYHHFVFQELTGALGDSDMSDDEIVAGDVIKQGDVMIHPRSDCPVHSFKKTFKQQKVIPENELYCEKCFCYICDIP